MTRGELIFWVAVEGEVFGWQITSTSQNAVPRMRKHPDVYTLWLLSYDGEFKSDEKLEEKLLKGMAWYRYRAAKGEVMFGYRIGYNS